MHAARPMGQWGPVENELDEYGHSGRVLALIIGRYGDASTSSYLSLISDLVARELARMQMASYNTGHLEVSCGTP